MKIKSAAEYVKLFLMTYSAYTVRKRHFQIEFFHASKKHFDAVFPASARWWRDGVRLKSFSVLSCIIKMQF